MALMHSNLKMDVYDSRTTGVVHSATARYRNALRYNLEKKCRQIEKAIDEGSIRELTSIFPRLLDSIFGLNYQNEWELKVLTRSANYREFFALREFLSPDGPLFELIYKLMGDASIRFDYPINYLPFSSRKAFEEGIIPPLYLNKLQNFPGQTATTVSLNPFEYYMFHFTNFLVIPYNLKMVSNWSVPGETLYPTLVDIYLNYFLPIDDSEPSPVNVSISPRSVTPIKTPPQYMTPVRQFRLLKNQEVPHIPVTSLKQNEQTRMETWRSEIMTEIFAEMWLNQNVQDAQSMHIFNAHGQQESFVVNLDHMRTVRMFIKHLHYFANSSYVGSENFLDEFKRNVIPQIIQKKFYWFLQNSILHWPLDASFRLVLETWLSYIQPWRYVGSNNSSRGYRNGHDEVDPNWRRFIMENIAFYTTLFQKIIPRFFRMELSTGKNAYMLYRVTKVFSQQNFAPLIKTAEHSLFEPVNRLADYCTQSPNDSYASRFTINPGLVATVRQQLMDLEKPGFQYIPLFGEEIKCQMKQLIGLINQARTVAQESCLVYDNKVGFFTKIGRGITNLLEGGGLGDESVIHDACKIDAYLLTASEQLCNIFNITPSADTIIGNGYTSDQTVDETSQSINKKNAPTCNVMSVKFQGNPDLQPIRSFEVKFLVRAFYKLSAYINETYRIQLRRLYHRKDFIGNFSKQILSPPVVYYQYDKTTFPPNRQQKVLPARLNLRPLAHKQLIGYYLFACCLSFVWGYSPVVLTFVLIFSIFVYCIVKATIQSVYTSVWGLT